jgi:lysophospholipase L1-like esterase
MRHITGTLLLALLVAGCGGDRKPFVPTQPNPTPTPTPDPTPTPVPPTFAVTRIMAFGDSLTEGDPPEPGQIFARPAHDPSTPGGAKSYPYKLQAILTSTYTGHTIRVFNLGRGGEQVTNSSAKERLLAALAAYQPEVLLLMHGTNDLLSDYPQNAIVHAVEELIELTPSRGVQRVFLASLPPQVPTEKATASQQVPIYNERLRTLASATGATFVDIYPHIERSMIEDDGLHLRESGNQKIAELFYAALRPPYHREPGQ